MHLFRRKEEAKGLPKGLDSEKNLKAALQSDQDSETRNEANFCWFHCNTNRNLAEYKLKQGGSHNGLYLVRQNLCRHHDFVLSMVHEKKFYHYEVKRQMNQINAYSIEEGFSAKGLEKLIEHYHSSGVKLPCPLKMPCKGQPPHPYYRLSGYSNLLHRAIAAGEEDLALRILVHPLCPDVNAKNAQGSTALHEACSKGMIKVVRELIKKEALGVMTDADGCSPLQIACRNNQADMVKILLQEGRLDPQDRHPQTLQVALHFAARVGSLDCVKTLLALNAAAFPRDKDGYVPSELASKNGHQNCASYIENYNPAAASTNRKLWFHDVPREAAEKILRDKGTTDGLFIVRRSSRNRQNYVLVLCYELTIKSYEIHYAEGIYYIDDGPLLPSLEHLVEYYCLRADGLLCCLLTSVNQDGQVVIPYTPEMTSENVEYYNTSAAIAIKQGANYQPVTAKAKRNLSKGQYSTPVISEPININPSTIAIGFELGQGEYGSVLSGEWTSPQGDKVKVAIKTLHNDYMASGKENFLREAKVMVKLNHPCIVQLIGVCPGQPVMLVQELMPMGSLLDYLLDYPERIQANPDLYTWAAQVAAGMSYLEKQGFVHRDLAARNILLADKRHAKVGDFGLSRAVEGNSNYYRATVGGRWPVKWYAPECVNYGTFSSASDVWGYGVTLWEMFSFGEQPYGTMMGAQVVAYLEKGKRLDQPKDCPDVVYDIMRQCWEYEPKKRPTFQELYHKFRTDPVYDMDESVFRIMEHNIGSTCL